MKKSVYLIDDDEDVRDVVKYALEEDGFIVHSFPDGQKGYDKLSALSKDFPGLIIVDYLMPKMDGMTFINLLKKHPSTSLGQIPVALFSAKEASEAPILKLPTGVLQIQKPMELEKLLEVVRHHCN